MRICAAADLHYPRTDFGRCAAIAAAMCASGADVLILAGDIATGPAKHYRKLLHLFREFPGPKLFVPGNHDLWSTARHPDTPRRYRETLRHTVEGEGFRYLPGSPIVHDGVGFVGCIGWYDYAFRQVEPPEPGLRVTPLRAVRTRHGPEFARDPRRHDVAWEELTPDDYAGHALLWRSNDGWRQLVWNDGLHTEWGTPDPVTAEDLAAELERDIDAVEAQVDYLVAALHFVPYGELIGGPSPDVEGAYVKAFLGSPLFGRVLAAHPKRRLVLCGHRHEAQVLRVGDTVAANCSVGDGNGGPLLLTVGAEREGPAGPSTLT